VGWLEPIRGWGRETLEDVLDALYPLKCALCGAATDGSVGCGAHELPEAPPGVRCQKCCAELPRSLEGAGKCAACRREAPGYARLIALADYRTQPQVRDWILAFKHGGRADLADSLGEALAARWSRAVSEDEREGALLVPVPLHPWRRIERGYDQARLLAVAVGGHARVPIARALARARPTTVQGSAGAVSRDANVRDAFRGSIWPPRAARRVAGASVWLVDDVVTSGATLRECARVLRGLGAAEVSALALARAARAPVDRDDTDGEGADRFEAGAAGSLSPA
jgi:ComF family protein